MTIDPPVGSVIFVDVCVIGIGFLYLFHQTTTDIKKKLLNMSEGDPDLDTPTFQVANVKSKSHIL